MSPKILEEDPLLRICRRFSHPFLRIVGEGRPNPVEVPRNQVSIHCKDTLMEGNVNTIQFFTRPRISNDENEYLEKLSLRFKGLPISNRTLTSCTGNNICVKCLMHAGRKNQAMRSHVVVVTLFFTSIYFYKNTFFLVSYIHMYKRTNQNRWTQLIRKRNKTNNYFQCSLYNIYNKTTGIAVACWTIPLSY